MMYTIHECLTETEPCAFSLGGPCGARRCIGGRVCCCSWFDSFRSSVGVVCPSFWKSYWSFFGRSRLYCFCCSVVAHWQHWWRRWVEDYWFRRLCASVGRHRPTPLSRFKRKIVAVFEEDVELYFDLHFHPHFDLHFHPYFDLRYSV